MKKISWIEGTLFFLALASAILMATFFYAADNNRGNVDRLTEKYAIIHSFDADEKIETETEKEQKNEKAAKLCEKLFGIFLVSALCLHLYHRFKRRNNVESQSLVTGEGEKEALSLANEITVNQAVAIDIHTESTSQVAVANIAVEQSPETETVNNQRSERMKELEKAPAETNDIGHQKEEISETFEERTKACKSDDNKPVVKTEAQKKMENARYAIGSTMDKSFRGPEDCIYNRFWEDVDAIVKHYPKPTGRRALIGKIATFVYRTKNESGQVITYASDPKSKHNMSYAKWIKTFFIASGVELKGKIREKDFMSFNLDTDAPEMKYLKAGSWEYFKDAEMRKRYLE